MNKRMVGCLIIGGLCVTGIATVACSDSALLWFVNATIPDAHLSQADLGLARQQAFADCEDVAAAALHKQCMLDSLSRHLRPGPSDTRSTSDSGTEGSLRI